MKSRKIEENIFKFLMALALFMVFLALAGIIIVVAIKGLSSLNLSMITETPKGGYYLGKEGGIANAIIGSLYLVIGATILSIIFSLPIALALQKEYLGRRFADFTRLVLDILWGTPSIVYGAFGFVIMVYFGLRASLLGGIIVLTLLMIPIMSRAMDEAIRLVPFELKEMSYALGATKIETTLAVVLRQAFPGLCTAVILAFGRGIGDAASILFTAGYTDEIPRSLMDPVASLPLAVFFQAGTPVPEVQARAFAAALILLFIVMIINIIARILGWRFSKNIVR
ncbi:MAG: phosphate ABC transporter, permease protein PstA [Deltaproteobacteria bacterium HGW-Deltaproteobacteria-2]|jgi:phosphate transport system permease protein|nr:MAG: phosphate ABC transporter, permease protein PstA [Deltaproteobacteria bacterium HGW-Deltaproteobacteria-2]